MYTVSSVMNTIVREILTLVVTKLFRLVFWGLVLACLYGAMGGWRI